MNNNPIPNHIRRGDSVAFLYDGKIRFVRDITIFRAKHGVIYLKGITAEGYRCFNGEKIQAIRQADVATPTSL